MVRRIDHGSRQGMVLFWSRLILLLYNNNQKSFPSSLLFQKILHNIDEIGADI